MVKEVILQGSTEHLEGLLRELRYRQHLVLHLALAQWLERLF